MQCGVHAFPIVPGVDVLNERPMRRGACREGSVLLQFPRERGEETLDDRVVPAIGSSTHTWDQLIVRQRLLIRRARVNAAAIRVTDESWLRYTERHGLMQDRRYQRTVVQRTRRPPDDAAGGEVENDGEIQPPFAARGQALVDYVMRVMVDGIVMPANTSIDGIFPKDAYGIEVFNGLARIPLNIGGIRDDNWCGLIAIWTRSG